MNLIRFTRLPLQPFPVTMVSTRAKAAFSSFVYKADEQVTSSVSTQVVVEPLQRAAKKRKIITNTSALPKAVQDQQLHQAADLLTSVQVSLEAKASRKKAKSRLLTTLTTAEALPKLQKKAMRIYDELMALYIDPPCPLDYENSFQLLVAVILSAQSTDKKVNEITPALFRVAPDARRMAQLEVNVIEALIKQIGLAPTKAKNISKMSKALLEHHEGEVPGTFEELEALAGVGHKTASVVMSVAFGLPSFPVDTHIYRLAQRWGLTSGKSVEQAEADLKVCWPEALWNPLHLRLIYFGREHCPAKNHDPTGCPICSWAAVPPYNRAGFSPLKAGAPRLTHS